VRIRVPGQPDRVIEIPSALVEAIVVNRLFADREGWAHYEAIVPTGVGVKSVRMSLKGNNFALSESHDSNVFISGSISGSIGGIGEPECLWCGVVVVVGYAVCWLGEQAYISAWKERAVDDCGKGRVDSVYASSICGLAGTCSWKCKE